MEFSGGVIVIGSLLWENTKLRSTWREGLDLNNGVYCRVPIRYGRTSSTRSDTYSMVFSKELPANKFGTGIILPFKVPVQTREQFLEVNRGLAKAEKIIEEGNPQKQTIVTSWGATCISLNPRLSTEKKDALTGWWLELFSSEKLTFRNRRTREFTLNNFGTNQESYCIDANGFLKIPFPKRVDGTNIKNFDFLLGTANKMAHRSSKFVAYPKPKEIAKAMVDGNSFDYFLNNLSHSIMTFQDRSIKKILRNKYAIELNDGN